MKSTTYITEITNQKNEKYLSKGRNSLACLLATSPLVSAKKFSAWFYWKLFCHFWPIKLRDFSHVVSATPIFLGIFFHPFYGTALRF